MQNTTNTGRAQSSEHGSSEHGQKRDAWKRARDIARKGKAQRRAFETGRRA